MKTGDREMAAHAHNGQTSTSLSFSKKPRTVRRDDCLVLDCQNLAKLDYESPFRDIFDAVDRLMPFHILHCERGNERDLESTKRELFEASCKRKLQEFQNRAENVRTQLESLESSFLRTKRRRPEEEYRLEKLASQSIREFYLVEKLALRRERLASTTTTSTTNGPTSTSHTTILAQRPMDYAPVPESGRKLMVAPPPLSSTPSAIVAAAPLSSHPEKISSLALPPTAASSAVGRLGPRLHFPSSVGIPNTELTKRRQDQ